MRYLIVIALFCMTSLSHAGVTQSKLELEKQIQDRVAAVMKGLDESAIISVKIKLRKIKAQSMGFSPNTEVVPLEDGNGLGEDGIENINIRVLTAKTEIPDWTKKEIDLVAQLDKVPIKVEFITKEVAKTQESPNALISKVDELMSSMGIIVQSVKFGFFGFLLLVFFSAAFIVWSVRSLSARFENSFGKLFDEKIVPNMNAKSQAKPIESQQKKEQVSASVNDSAQANETISGLPTPSVLSLFTDCYWTENDGYAHFLWSRLTVNQREELLKNWTLDSSYFNYLMEVPETSLSYHLNPFYLNSKPQFETINQVHLYELLEKTEKLVSELSPMRWESLSMPLIKRVELSSFRNQERSLSAVPTINKKSEKRALETKLRITSVSLEDEEVIWKNPSLVPVSLRSEIPTLIWLALAQDSERKKVLNDLDARQLAEAWVGPLEVLAILESDLAPKKLEMVKYFSTSSEPSRDSDSFKYLHQMSVTLKVQPTEVVEPSKAAS